MNEKPNSPIDDLLAAAAAPSTNAELRREDHAVMMFNAAHLASLTAPRREPMSSTPRRFAAKSIVAAIAAATFATAGIAMAATGNLPGTGTGQGNGVGNGNGQGVANANPKAGLAGDAETEPTEPTDEGTEPTEPTDEGTETTEPTEDPTTTDEATPQSLRGLCRAISVGNKAEQGKSLEAPPFAALIEAAGGIDNVEAYCLALLGPDTKPEKPVKTDKPDKPAKPEKTDKPDKPAKPEKTDKPAKAPNENKPENPGKP
jgi:outer membrane biosynthesis protein TonB